MGFPLSGWREKDVGIGVEPGRAIPACHPTTSEPPPQPPWAGFLSLVTFLATEV